MQNLGSNFYPKLVQISSELGMKPEDILNVMVSESGLNPGSSNSIHAGGLVGFMPKTLQGLGYKGEWSDFVKMQGQDQLDYVKKLIEGNQKYNGAPFTSAAQYYVANFFPVALRLPGIKKGDPSTVFIEENPAVVVDEKTGRKYSKKYYDIGIKIDPAFESKAYKENSLFHGKVPGAITYGDMMNQVDKNKRTSIYRQALENMQNTTGYVATETTRNIPDKPSSFSNFVSKLEKLLSMFIKASDQQKFLISVGSSSDYYSTMEYARVFASAIEEYLGAKTIICADQNNIEIECFASKNQYTFDAIKELSVGVADAFKYATKKIGSVSAFALVMYGSKSDYEPIHPRKADLCSRMFKIKFKAKQ